MPETDQPQILENLTTAVLLFDEELKLSYANPAAEMLLSVSAKRIQGCDFGAILSSPDNSLEPRVRKAFVTGHPYTERERQVIVNDKRPMTVDCTITPLAGPGARRWLLLEMVRLDRQLRILEEEHLLIQQEATRMMVRGMAHEIKNPLGGLRGAAQLLEKELSDESLKEYTRIIIGEADRLHKLVDRMLGPNNMPNMQDVSIHEIMEHVRNLLLAEAPPEIQIGTDYDPSIPSIYADRDLLVQAVLNVMRNALQALPQRGEIMLTTRIMRQFTIGKHRHRLVVKIDITDNGPGIPEEILQKIFYPLVSGNEQGTGLGLSIAQSLINQHKGIIECESQPGRTTFRILLPVEHKSHDR